MKKEQSSGCIELELPSVTLETCQKLDTGQVIYVSGTARRQGLFTEESIQIQMKKNENQTISLALYCESLGCILQEKLTNTWHCVLERILPTEKASGETRETDLCLVVDRTIAENKSALSSRDVSAHPQSKSNQWSSDGSVEGSELADRKMEATQWHDCVDDRHESLKRPNSGASGELCTNEGSNSGIPTESDHDETGNGCFSDNEKNKAEESSEPREKLKLACKFCLKPFHKGKNPLMNLQKHIVKCCPVLHPKQGDHVTPELVESGDSNNAFVCCYCSKLLSTKYNLARHVETCKKNPNNKADLSKCNGKLFYCDDCHWPTRTELDLHKHRVQNHGAPKRPRKKPTVVKPVACRYCGELFKFTSSRCNHEHFKCPKNLNITKSFFCRYCGTRCRSQEALDAHTEQKHSNRKCVCKLCGAEFNTRNSKWHHMITTHRENPRRFACTFCESTYINKRTLLQHMTKHFDERKVQCTICGKCFKNQAQEKSHRRHVHEGCYRFRCTKCGHGVARRQYLLSHKCGRVRRVQDGERAIREQGDETMEERDARQTASTQQPEPPSNITMATTQHGLKTQDNSLMSSVEAEMLYYRNQPTSVLPSFPQMLTNSQGLSQMPSTISQPLPVNNYLSSSNFLPYSQQNC